MADPFGHLRRKKYYGKLGNLNFSGISVALHLESPQYRAILYIRLLLHGLILGGFKQNWWPQCSPLPDHLVYGFKNAMTDGSFHAE